MFIPQSFGAETREIITLNLPHGDGFNAAMLVKICLCFALLFTYPGALCFHFVFASSFKTAVMMFPVTEMLERKFTRAVRKRKMVRYCAEVSYDMPLTERPNEFLFRTCSV